MNFIWLQDCDFMVEGGGAQNTDRSHFLEGIRRGHSQHIVIPGGDLGILKKDDNIIIVSNAATFGIDVFKEMVDKKRKYIFFFHDYVPICKYRLFYPIQKKCYECYKRESWIPILTHSSFLIWLSPLHRKSWLEVCPELESLPFAVVPSPIDPKQFYDIGLEREGVISVNSLVDFKGKESVIRWAEEHPQTPITFVGAGDGPVELPPNCKMLGGQSFWSMNKLYNRHKAFLHLPTTPQPFERVVAEAYLAGCDIIGNSLIGALSYDWFTRRDEVAFHCGSASETFWLAIEKRMEELK